MMNVLNGREASILIPVYSTPELQRGGMMTQVDSGTEDRNKWAIVESELSFV